MVDQITRAAITTDIRLAEMTSSMMMILFGALLFDTDEEDPLLEGITMIF
jgi:hypothetical protein